MYERHIFWFPVRFGVVSTRWLYGGVAYPYMDTHEIDWLRIEIRFADQMGWFVLEGPSLFSNHDRSF